jgi:hypothetical protein
MRHRINQWIQRLIAPGMIVVGLILQHLGFGIVKTLSILVDRTCPKHGTGA